MITVWKAAPRLPSLAEEVSRLMLNNDVALPTAAFTAAGLAPVADVLESESAYLVSLDLPGLDPQAIQLQVEKDTLTIQAERKFTPPATGEQLHRSERPYGAFARSFTLPSSVDASRVEARYVHGVLTVTLPKREEARARSIPVKVA